MALYQIQLSYACYGILVNRIGIVSEAPPIARWMVGHTLTSVDAWIASKRGRMALVGAA